MYPQYICRVYLCIRHTPVVDIYVPAIHLTWISVYPPHTCHFFGFCRVPRPMAMLGSHRVASSPVIFPSKVASTSLVVMTCDTSSTVRRHSHKRGTRKTETRPDVTTPRLRPEKTPSTARSERPNVMQTHLRASAAHARPTQAGVQHDGESEQAHPGLT